MRRATIILVLSLAAVGSLRAKDSRHRDRDDDHRGAPFHLLEATIPQIQVALEDGRITSTELVSMYLRRIDEYEDTLNAYITLNPNALAEARSLDRERRRGNVRGPLHGIPIVLKDNIHTRDMLTTGGALAFAGLQAPYEATLARKLRRAGAIILGKTVLTELANWVAGAPTPMPGNYSAVGGFGMNPYDPREDPRAGLNDGRPVMATGGSSSGIATAANLAVANIGTETSGSILSPSNQNMLAGIKPTVGLISRHGVIPITADQDTAGPMARTVTDAAIMLGVLTGPDRNDPATSVCRDIDDYTRFLKRNGLRGKRIGIPRAFYFDPVALPSPPGGTSGGLLPDRAALMAEAIQILQQAGATVVDPADIPSVVTADAGRNLLLWGICAGANQAKGLDANCSVVLKYGAKRDMNAWMESLGSASDIDSLTELRTFNLANVADNAIKYGQSRLDISDEMDLATDRARYLADRAKDLRLAGTEGIDAAIKAHRLDALMFPAATGADIAARPGYPTVIVPFGKVANILPGIPAGFDPKPQPYGVSFTGGACSEPTLLQIAYAFEQASRRAGKGRVPPESAPALPGDTVTGKR
jgi:amidase